MDKDNKSIHVTARIPNDILDIIRLRATKNCRSLSKEIVYILKQYITKNEAN